MGGGKEGVRNPFLHIRAPGSFRAFEPTVGSLLRVGRAGNVLVDEDRVAVGIGEHEVRVAAPPPSDGVIGGRSAPPPPSPMNRITPSFNCRLRASSTCR